MKKDLQLFSRIKNRMETSLAFKRIAVSVLCLAVLLFSAGIAVLAVSASVKASVSDRIVEIDQVNELEDIDLVIVLGAGLRPDGSPSDMLADRLRVGVTIMESGSFERILMSGDNSGEDYNEVAAMKAFAMENGVSESAILVDGEGYSTYESISRVISEYDADRILIVTQEYHLYRALYIAKALGIEAYGVSADFRPYRGQFYRNTREHFARFKDFILTIETD